MTRATKSSKKKPVSKRPVAKRKSAAKAKPAAAEAPNVRERFEALVASLKNNAQVRVIHTWINDGAVGAARIASKAGVTLGSSETRFYEQMNGCGLIWAHADEAPALKFPKGPLTPMQIEALDTSVVKIIALLPIEQVMKPYLDYGKYLDDKTRRFAFDLPGTQVTPAYVIRNAATTVEVGHSSGALWPKKQTTFDNYIDTVFASAGDVETRKAVFVEGKRLDTTGIVPVSTKGTKIAPTKKIDPAKLGKLLKAKSGADLDDNELAAAVAAIGIPRLSNAALWCLRSAPQRLKPFGSQLAASLDAVAADDRSLLMELIANSGAVLSAADRQAVLAIDPSDAWREQSTIIARSASSAEVATLIEEAMADVDGYEVKLRAGAMAAQASPITPSTLKLFEPLLTPVGDGSHLAMMAATAIVAHDSSRAATLLPYLAAALELYQVFPGVIATASRLPPALRKKLPADARAKLE